MYSMIDPEKTYNDELICLNQGILYRKGKPKTFLPAFRLFPNPENETFSVRYDLVENQKAQLVLFLLPHLLDCKINCRGFILNNPIPSFQNEMIGLIAKNNYI